MKNCIISVFIVLSLLILAFAGCTANKPDDKDGDRTTPDENGENTEGDRTTPDENGENNDNAEIVKVVDSAYGQGTISLDEEDAKALLSALNSLEWVDTGGVCDCDPDFYIYIGETRYQFSHGDLCQGTKKAQDSDGAVKEILKKHFSYVDGEDSPRIKATSNIYSTDTVTLTAEESQTIRDIINSLEWTDMGEPCDCMPHIYFYIGETMYGFTYGEIEQGTRHSQDTSGIIQHIFAGYFNFFWDEIE